MSYTHYIEGVQVYPAGDWKIKHTRAATQVFHRRMFDGELTFGNAWFNKKSSNDFDYITSFSGCQRLNYEIKCSDGSTYWQGFISYPYDIDIDYDKCILTITPYADDNYHKCASLGDRDYTFQGTPVNVYLFDRTPTGACNSYTQRALTGGYKLRSMIYSTFLTTGYMGVVSAETDIVSTFFWNDNWPDGTAYHATNNYVTGTTNYLSPANDYDIVLANMSTVLVNFGAGSGTETLRLSFNEFMLMLAELFQVYWYIDTNGKFRLEHIYYFDPDFPHAAHTDVRNEGFDVTSITAKNGKSYAWRKNKIYYDKQLYLYSENFKTNNASNEDFVGEPIEYDASCALEFPEVRESDHELNDVTTDIDAVYDDAAGASSQGLAFLHVIYDDRFSPDATILTTWPSNTYDTTFTTSGSTINRATQTAVPAPAVYGQSNTISLTIGKKFKVCITNYTTYGGHTEDPYIYFWNTGAGVAASNFEQITADGIYILTATANGSYPLRIWNTQPADYSLAIVIDDIEYRYSVVWEQGQLSGNWFWNNHLSWANLHNRYWKYNRAMLTGNMNGAPTNFLSQTRKKVQENIEFTKGPDCCANALDAFDIIKTEQGWGVIDGAEETENTIKVKLYHK